MVCRWPPGSQNGEGQSERSILAVTSSTNVEMSQTKIGFTLGGFPEPIDR